MLRVLGLVGLWIIGKIIGLALAAVLVFIVVVFLATAIPAIVMALLGG